MGLGKRRMGRLTTTFTRAYGISCGGVTRCNPAEPTASALKRCSASWEYCNSAVFRWSLVRESAVKPVGKPDAGNPHVRFDERGWETGRRSGVSARAHPRLYKSAAASGSANSTSPVTPFTIDCAPKATSLLPVSSRTIGDTIEACES